MKVSKQFISILFISLLTFSGCESSTNNTEIASKKENTHHHSEEDIQLNNGEKWLVEPSMLLIIRKMEKEVNQFDQQSFSQLGKQLTIDIEELTSNCTMTGQAHDELHKWLLPYIDMVDHLVQTNDQKEAKAVYQQIKQSFHTFNQYFK